MEIRKSKNSFNARGSSTIEMLVIFPVTLLGIIAVIYLCIILYQQVYIQSIANDAVLYGSYCTENVEESVKGFIENKLKMYSAVESVDKGISVEVKRKALSQHIEVSIVNDYSLPLGFRIKINAKAHKEIDKPVDFIRKLDVLAELIGHKED